MNLKMETDRETMRKRGNMDVDIDVIDYYINFNSNSLLKTRNARKKKVKQTKLFQSKNSVLKSQNDLYALMHSTSVPLNKEFLLNLNDEEFQVLWTFIEQEQTLIEIHERESKVRNMLLDTQSQMLERSKMNYEIYNDCFKEFQRELLRNQSSSKSKGIGMKGSLLFEIKHKD